MKMSIVRKCAACGKIVDYGMTDLEGFYAHEECLPAALDKYYGEGKWLHEDDWYGEEHYTHYVGDGEWEDTGIFYTDFEEDLRWYEVEYTDPETAATSPIDKVAAPEGYTAADYIQDCEENAPEEWCEMLRRGVVSIQEVEQ